MYARHSLTIGCLGMIGLLLVSSGWSQLGTAERLGDQIGDALEDVREGAEELAGEARERFEQARDAVARMGLEARVYARLHWDKALHDSSLSVEVDDRGVAILRGTVPDRDASSKAERLAAETVGIQRVVNELTLAAKPSP
jgi:hyperosmotically inducible periplasmic protein